VRCVIHIVALVKEGFVEDEMHDVEAVFADLSLVEVWKTCCTGSLSCIDEMATCFRIEVVVEVV